ncbi:MAG: YitT family protein [Eubacteriales bacterium]|nr:YitT family protein [Eubacteriales bacterium]
MNAQTKESLKNAAYIIIGLFSCSLGYCMFLVPNEIAPGGFTGIGQLCNALFGINVGTMALILNVPLFAVSMRSMGIKFGVKSLAASIGLSLLIDYLPIGAVTDDLLLATVFGALLGGIGFGLILRGNATTGGTDMLASLIHTRVPTLRVGVLITMVDGLVVLASAFVFSPKMAMYALISVFIMNYTLDYVLDGMNRSTAYLIVSQKSDEIASQVLGQLERGVTGLYGRGRYSGQETEVLLCVVSRFEVIRLRRIVSSCDPRAFMIAINAHEVLGEGFKDISGKQG